MNDESVSRQRRLKVALLTTSFPLADGETGGVFVKHLVEAMPPEIAVTVIAPAPAYPVSIPSGARYALALFRYAPLQLQTLAHRPGGIPSALSQSRAAWLLLPCFLVAMGWACLRAARRADVIHANWSANGVIAGLAGWLCDKPVVTTLRGSDIGAVSRSKSYAFALRMCIRLSSRLVAVSQSMGQTLVAGFPRLRSKILFIPNGVWDAFLSIERDVERPAEVVTVVGSLTKNKDVASVIRAIGRLNGYRLSLRVIGDGSERTALKGLAAALGVSDRVDFAGPLPQEAVAEALRQTDIFVLASFSEGRPNALVEAMAAGLAIVGTNINGVRELVEDGVNGLLFEPGDAEQLAVQIRRLCENGALRARLSRQARQKIIDAGLSWPGTAARYADLYRSLAA